MSFSLRVGNRNGLYVLITKLGVKTAIVVCEADEEADEKAFSQQDSEACAR